VLVGVLVVACLGALMWLVVRPGPPSLASQRKEAAAYRAGPIENLIQDAGPLIVREIKPSLSDLSTHKLSPEQFRGYASGWRARFERMRATFNRCPAPSKLRPAARLYDQSIREYVQAVDAFAAASTRPESELGAAITEAVPAADKADRTYDQADAMVKKELRRLDLPERPPKSAAAGLTCLE